MIIYFLSALLIAAMVFKLGTYTVLVGLMIAAAQSIAVSAVLACLVLLWRWYRGKKQGVKLIG